MENICFNAYILHIEYDDLKGGLDFTHFHNSSFGHLWKACYCQAAAPPVFQKCEGDRNGGIKVE